MRISDWSSDVCSSDLVTTFGTVNDINTSAFIDGDVLYSSATGTLTTAVTASFVGVVLNASPSIGRILVIPRSLDQAFGTTAQRPTVVPTGFRWFDTTLGIPVWRDNGDWEIGRASCRQRVGQYG